MFLKTDRLILRRFSADDIDLLVELDADPEVMRYLSGGQATPRDEIAHEILPHWLGYYDRFEGYGFWAAEERTTGTFVGWFHLRPQNGCPADEPELGYRLRRSAWGSGFGTEGSRALLDKAFGELGATRIVASTYQDNLASRRVMEKVGMRLVRTFRFTPDELEFHGIRQETIDEHFPGDEVEYAITRDEWASRRHQ